MTTNAKLTKEQAALELEIQKLSVTRQGTKLVLPDGLSYKAAIAALQRKIEEDERDIEIHEKFDMTVPEGAIAFYRALNELYGFVDSMSTPGFFSERPPALIKVQVSPSESVTVPWGRFGVPGVKGYIATQVSWKNGVPYFAIAATVAGRCRDEIDRLSKTIRLQHAAIYKGKSIRVAFPSQEEATSMEDFFPQFLTLPNVSKTDLIFTSDVQELVEVGLFTPVEKTQFCRDHAIPLKRGILLEGPYGVGKTLTVNVAAKLCEANGWTFIQVGRARDLAQAIAFALLHQPAMVFCEDLDEVLQDEEDRDEKINAILNQADGVDSKGAEVITVFTTNDLEAITKAMLRPGRIDTVVPVRPPDAQAAQRLIRLYAGGSLSPDEDLTNAGKLLDGKNAAVVREVVTRSKLSAVRRVNNSSDELTLNAHDIEIAALGIQAHSELLLEEEDDDRSAFEKGCETLADSIRDLRALPAGVANGVAPALALAATSDPATTAEAQTHFS
jgi:transitional endoplasmic reticulum ATPase